MTPSTFVLVLLVAGVTGLALGYFIVGPWLLGTVVRPPAPPPPPPSAMPVRGEALVLHVEHTKTTMDDETGRVQLLAVGDNGIGVLLQIARVDALAISTRLANVVAKAEMVERNPELAP